jgi:hypothetical protein
VNDSIEGAPFDGSELEFWLGSWDATWEGGHGTNRLERVLDGAVIHERFEEAPGDPGAPGETNGRLIGESWSVFDPARGLWRQTWVDNQGGYYDLVGERVDGWFAFVRAAPELGPNARQRMVFRDVAADRFRWTWELSRDHGATWAVRWEIDYRRAAHSVA